MLQQSAVLTVLGMTVVFIFLWIMIVCINFVGKVIHSIRMNKDAVKPENKVILAGKTVTPETIAVISASVTKYRKESKSL